MATGTIDDHEVTFTLDPSDPASLTVTCRCGWTATNSSPVAAKRVADEVTEHLRKQRPKPEPA